MKICIYRNMRDPKKYKDITYRLMFFDTEWYEEDQVRDFLLNKINIEPRKVETYIFNTAIVQLNEDDTNEVLSISLVDREYLGPDKLYYFYNTLGKIDPEIDIQIYELTRERLLELNSQPDYIGNIPYLGIILNKKKQILISALNLKSCDTPYPEGTVWYDKFDGTDLII